ncbi:histidine phosphatase family protein [Actinomycetospora cinnamomea]|uniref:Glucosyl-3-phosphoglycerate phosphatase (Pgm family) n=1 Tax=Actinomycetospora cinnamomea TaxID=663609 RepID=A0A2U1EZ23_9PSEU|nr:histidine phosphatase family protein [Actinomycetospora cinnamomea]PVZ04990.1 glucosyl-3-phosphoglycerate phosphatase (pgm family) [Actinomycetospora cinnamomea]
MSLQRLVLVRHGRTTWNAESRMQGRLDPELDETGRAQALAAAPVLTVYEPVLLVASDQVRAWRTAEAVAKEAALVPRPEPRLRETALGDWEGLTGREVEDGWPGGLESWRTDPAWAPPGGESRVDVARRAVPVLDDLAGELAGTDERQTAMVVAHGGTISALTASTLGWPIEAWHSLQPLANCAWAVLEHRIDRWRLRAWGLEA